MDFQYGTSFGKKSPEAYERLLLDAMLGDSTLFARGDMVELSWELVMPILQKWTESADHFPNYEAGEWGPKEADEFLERDGRRWRRPSGATTHPGTREPRVRCGVGGMS